MKQTTDQTRIHLPRRQFIKGASLVAGSLVAPQLLAAETEKDSLFDLFLKPLDTLKAEVEKRAKNVKRSVFSSKSSDVRSIALHNLHTGEKTAVDYCIDGKYEKDALAEINKVMRDHRNDAVRDIDNRLVDLLYNLQKQLGAEGKTFEVISGYRSPESNAKLRQKSRGVAKESFHMKGMAIDTQIKGHSSDKLFAAAKELKLGGTGFYGKSRFVHIDVGSVRSWRG